MSPHHVARCASHGGPLHGCVFCAREEMMRDLAAVLGMLVSIWLLGALCAGLFALIRAVAL